MVLVGTFPFNSFLAGFFCSLGFFVLTGARHRPGACTHTTFYQQCIINHRTVCLRMQLDPTNKDFKDSISPERAFADYVLCNLVLFLAVWNFMG